MRRIRGLIDLVFSAIDETTHLVERTHRATVERAARRFGLIEPAKSAVESVGDVQTTIASGVCDSIRTVNRLVRSNVNVASGVTASAIEHTVGSEQLELSTPVQSDAPGMASWYIDYLQAGLNGVWGDYLSRHKSRLDLGMTLRHQGKVVERTPEALGAAFPNATEKVCVFVHGLVATEWLWSLSSEEYYGAPDVTFGTRLAGDLGFTPLYVRYNTGKHISENGRALAELLTEIVKAYPVSVKEIALVGHSMGGLVVRSCAHYAREKNEPWVDRLRHVACIGAPNFGAPLEKAVNVVTHALRSVDTAATSVIGELLQGRSAGIKDTRYGYTVDEEWMDRDPDEVFADARRNIPLVDGVGYYFLAATISPDPEDPVSQILGDLVVHLPSARGAAPQHNQRIPFEGGAVFPNMTHLHLANHPDVYEALRNFFNQ